MKPIIIITLLIFISCSCDSKEDLVCSTHKWTTPESDDVKFEIKEPIKFNVPFDKTSDRFVIFTTSNKSLNIVDTEENKYDTYVVQFDLDKKQTTKAWKIDSKISSYQGTRYSKKQDRYFISDIYGKVYKFNQYTGELKVVGDMKYQRTAYLFWTNETFYQETNIICHTYLDENIPNASGSIWKVFNVNQEVQEKEEICLPEWGSGKTTDGEKLYFLLISELYIYDPITDSFTLEKDLKQRLEENDLRFGGIADLSYKGKIYLGLNKRKVDSLIRDPLYEYDLETKELKAIIKQDFSQLMPGDNVRWGPVESKRFGDIMFIKLNVGNPDFGNYFLIKVNLKNDSCVALYKNIDYHYYLWRYNEDFLHIGSGIMNIHDYSIMRTTPISKYTFIPERIK